MAMSWPRKWGMAGYFGASLPLRWWLRRVARRRARLPVIVLFYHRIADTTPNDWTMSTGMFCRQLEWLRQHVDLVSLEEAQQRIRSGRNDRVAVSITFDDGYADNCDTALPLLVRWQVPCTYFVAVDHVVTQQPFPHDVAAGVPLQPNSVEQLRMIADAGIEVGVHTRTHADIGALHDGGKLYDEIVGAGADLSDLLRRPMRFFAFPYGLPHNVSAAAFQLGREAGYQAMCSAYGAYNVPGADAFHLRRVHADPEWLRWRNWLGLDPRKWRRAQRPDAVDRMSLADEPAACDTITATDCVAPRA